MSGGCTWQPFALDEGEYDELVEELQRRGQRPVIGRSPGGEPFRRRDLPSSISTFDAWAAFRYEEATGHALSQKVEEPTPGYQEWLTGCP
jgi:hypothetical protein